MGYARTGGAFIHTDKHPFAGKKVLVSDRVEHPQFPGLAGGVVTVEDWWDRVAGQSWMTCQGNPACLVYAMRTGFARYDLPLDNEVVYAHFNGFGQLLHETELDGEYQDDRFAPQSPLDVDEEDLEGTPSQ